MDTENKVMPPVRKDKEIELKRMEVGLVSQVISDEDLKTQYSQSERILITLLEDIATKPFSISERLAKEQGIKFDMKRYEYPLLSEMVHGYSRKGKALNRKGIDEDVKVVSAYFEAQRERAKLAEHQSKISK